MQNYVTIEGAVRERILEHFSDILNEDTCKIADSDELFRNLIYQKAVFGCFVDFGAPPGRMVTREPFKGQHWVWMVVGVFIVRYDENVNDNIRMVINRLVSLLRNDHTLGGLVPQAILTGIDSPEVVAVNDIPYYFLPFTMDIWDRYTE